MSLHSLRVAKWMTLWQPELGVIEAFAAFYVSTLYTWEVLARKYIELNVL